MFGLTFEKLFVVAIIAVFLIGPQRLPEYARKLADLVRALRRFVESSRTTAEAELGIPRARTEWESLDLRRYDPRVILREALEEPRPDGQQATGEARGEQPPATAAATTTPAPATTAAAVAPEIDVSRIRPGQKYLVSGSAAHPVRIRIDSLPLDDPRRIAAMVEPQPGTSEPAVPDAATNEPAPSQDAGVASDETATLADSAREAEPQLVR